MVSRVWNNHYYKLSVKCILVVLPPRLHRLFFLWPPLSLKKMISKEDLMLGAPLSCGFLLGMAKEEHDPC
jgi:hypothetical protein